MVCSPGPRPPGLPFRWSPDRFARSRFTLPDEPELEDTWSAIQAELRAAVTDSTYQIWLQPLALRAVGREELLVVAPDEIRGWVSDRFGRLLQTCAGVVVGRAIAVRLVGPDEQARRDAPQLAGLHGRGRTAPASPAGGGPRTTAGRRGEHSPAHHGRSSEPLPVFNPKYTFDQYVIGDANRLAHAAALAVAELPGQAYNPLFVYGPPGLGKTHLLHSIGNYAGQFEPGLGVRYTTTEAFTNEFVQALHSGDIDSFKAAYRHTDILLIDDVQFLESKAKTEEEFFHTFNALYETGSQLVLTSDRLPRDLAALEERLRERFESGLVTDVRPPDYVTRLAILRKRARHDRITGLADGALECIAERITDNIRSLEGALIRVVAFHSLTRRPITTDLVEDVLSGLYAAPRPPRRSIGEIQEATAEAFGVTPADLVSQSRAARVTWPRQVAMYLARELTDQTLPAIGRSFGGRNHATVLHAHRRTSDRIASDRQAYDVVRRLTRHLGSPDVDRLD